MSEVIEICGAIMQTTQVIGIGALEMKITPGDFETTHRLSFDLVLRNHSVRVELGTFVLNAIPGNYPETDLEATHRLRYGQAMASYDQGKQKVIDIIKLRPAHEL